MHDISSGFLLQNMWQEHLLIIKMNKNIKKKKELTSVLKV